MYYIYNSLKLAMNYKYLGRFYQKYMTRLEITDGQKAICGKLLYSQIENRENDMAYLKAVFTTSLMTPYFIANDDVISARLCDIIKEDDNFESVMKLMKEAYLQDKHRITRMMVILRI